MDERSHLGIRGGKLVEIKDDEDEATSELQEGELEEIFS